MNSKRLLLALLAVTLAALGIFAVQLNWPKRNADRPADRPVTATRPAETDPFTAIAPTPEFRAALAGAIRREVTQVAPAWPAAKVDRLTDMTRDYLVAFQSGDFETYWRFRVPTGRCPLHPETVTQLRNHILRRQEQTGSRHISAADLEATTDPKALLALVWKLLGPGGEALVPGRLNYIASNRCYRGVLLADVRVTTGRVLHSDYGRACMSIGASNSPFHPPKGLGQGGMLDLRPTYEAILKQDSTGVEVAAVKFTIRLDSGNIRTVFVAAFWNEAEDGFMPMVHVMSRNDYLVPF